MMITIPFGRCWFRLWRPKYWKQVYFSRLEDGWVARAGPLEFSRVARSNPYRQKLRWSR